MADRVTVKYRLDDDWVDAWRADGLVSLAPGDVLTTSTVGDSFAQVDVAENPTGVVGEKIVVVIYDADDTDNLTSSFLVSAETVLFDWTDPSGQLTPGVCASLDD